MTDSVLPASDPRAMATCVAVLRSGGIAVIPTDTVYGLACSVLNPKSVARVFQIKRRASTAPVPVLIATAADLTILAADVPTTAWKLIDRFWPGALTLVFPARPSVPPLITARTGTVALRVPAAGSCLQLLETFGEPVTGTSANRSGEVAAATAAQALEALGTEVDAILEDDASVRGGPPSTVVSLVGSQPVIHRLGAVSAEAIHQALGRRVEVRQELTGGHGGG